MSCPQKCRHPWRSWCPCAETTRSVPAHHYGLSCVSTSARRRSAPCRSPSLPHGWEGSRHERCNHSCAAGGHAACACLQEHGAPHADLCSAGGGHLRHPRRRQLAGYYGDHGRTGSTGCFVPNRGKDRHRLRHRRQSSIGGGRDGLLRERFDSALSDSGGGSAWRGNHFSGSGTAAPASGDGVSAGTAQKRRDLRLCRHYALLPAGTALRRYV